MENPWVKSKQTGDNFITQLTAVVSVNWNPKTDTEGLEQKCQEPAASYLTVYVLDSKDSYLYCMIALFDITFGLLRLCFVMSECVHVDDTRTNLYLTFLVKFIMVWMVMEFWRIDLLVKVQ